MNHKHKVVFGSSTHFFNDFLNQGALWSITDIIIHEESKLKVRQYKLSIQRDMKSLLFFFKASLALKVVTYQAEYYHPDSVSNSSSKPNL